MSSRYYAAATMWGLAVGAMAYRYGVLPFAWSSSWKHVLPGLAIGLAVAGQQLLRSDEHRSERKRPAIAVLVSLGVVGALIAAGLAYLAFPTLSRLSLERREFPGFSLAIPSGEVLEDRKDYALGKLSLKNVGGVNGVVIVNWQLGESMTTEELTTIGALLAKALGDQGGSSHMIKVTGPTGTPVDTIVFSGSIEIMMSALPCGGRTVMVATGGRDASESLHERIVRSFACKPDPALEATAKITFPLVIDLPGWYQLASEPDQLQITDGESALTMRTQDPNLKVDVALIVEPMFKAAGMEGKITSRSGERVNLVLTADGDSMNGWVRLKNCPTGTAFLLALSDNDATLDMLYARVDNARCLRPGEAAQEWPAAPADAPPPP